MPPRRAQSYPERAAKRRRVVDHTTAAPAQPEHQLSVQLHCHWLRFVGLFSPLLSPVQCSCCRCKFQLLCCAWVSLTIFSGIPFFGLVAHIQFKPPVCGTVLPNILIFVRYGIAYAVNLCAHWIICCATFNFCFSSNLQVTCSYVEWSCFLSFVSDCSDTCNLLGNAWH